MTLSCNSVKSSADGPVFPRQDGFTLLEVLVALAIAGLAIAAMTGAVRDGLTAGWTAAGYQEGVARARSHLAALASDRVFAVGTLDGDDGGGYHWRTRVAEKAHQTFVGGLDLFELEVGVSWTTAGRRREVVLVTERVGRPAQRAP
ncbi:MAG: prepilin-type N-terminal cleavage/methylation domain-containing protein [Telmatospirillum sp.]|nr:prepilin-type N-terminal cleavage/methylation domain-containing protein [Telmatospirillum sp.]